MQEMYVPLRGRAEGRTSKPFSGDALTKVVKACPQGLVGGGSLVLPQAGTLKGIGAS